ncbi:MAG: nuclear transport factor 2 family protein [Hyphomicrobiaceae bacterium]
MGIFQLVPGRKVRADHIRETTMPYETDRDEIRNIVKRQFESLSWGRNKRPDLPAFTDDFIDGASLYPAARPVRGKSVDAFAGRMQALSQSTLKSLDEQLRGLDVHVFGNVAVAMAVCELTENDTEVSRNVEAMLFVRSDGRWRIAAQAWDTETAEKPVPAALLNAPQPADQGDA